jgi:L-lactate dehydrogenase complex protein LldE
MVKGTVALKIFLPCFIDQGAPQLGEAVTALLDRWGVPWEYPEDQTCCGQFAYTLGDFATARRVARHFLRVFGAGEVLCPSASCTYMVRHGYPRVMAEGRKGPAKGPRVWELSEWLAARGALPWTPRFNGTLVLHHSCKARQLGILGAAAQVLGQVSGLKLLTVSPYYTCCGFGGTFKFQNPKLSRLMGEDYLEAVRATGAQGLVSLDYSCLLHLKDVAAGRGWDLQFYHLVEIISRGLGTGY